MDCCVFHIERAIFTQTIRGKEKVVYRGQPFAMDATVRMSNGRQKRTWRCSQWWSEKCRARIYTIGDLVFPMKKEHTHQDIIIRKQRADRKIKHRVARAIDSVALSSIKEEAFSSGY